MLKHKENIKDHGKESQSKFCRISKNWAPVIVVVRDKDHLKYTKWASGEIQQDISYTPAHSTFTPRQEKLK